MLYTEDMVRSNLRNRGGKRVFYLSKGDTLTPGARDWLRQQRVEILSADQAKPDSYRLLNGANLTEKPEHMTHLNGDSLVLKTHPRIAFRGALDTLEAQLLLCAFFAQGQLQKDLQEILSLARQLIRSDVLEAQLPEGKLCGLTEGELRSHSHRPQDYYTQPHFMPEITDGETILRLNRCRCAARAAELAAARAFTDENGNAQRTDILRAMNRMSSMLYILMIREKSKKQIHEVK